MKLINFLIPPKNCQTETSKTKRKFKTYLIDEILRNDDETASESKQHPDEKSSMKEEIDVEISDSPPPPPTEKAPEIEPRSASVKSAGDHHRMGELSQQHLYYNYFYQALMSSQNSFKCSPNLVASQSSKDRRLPNDERTKSQSFYSSSKSYTLASDDCNNLTH